MRLSFILIENLNIITHRHFDQFMSYIEIDLQVFDKNK